MDRAIFDKEELITKIKNLKSNEYIKHTFRNEELEFDIVIERVKCKFLGNLMMTLDNAVNINFLNIGKILSNVIIPMSMLNEYINLLKEAKNESEVLYVYLLMNSQLLVNDKITLETDNRNKKICVIQPPTDKYSGQILYKIIKKDGTLGLREFILYGKTDNFNYYCEDRAFINFKEL